jgi:hypothetical protein
VRLTLKSKGEGRRGVMVKVLIGLVLSLVLLGLTACSLVGGASVTPERVIESFKAKGLEAENSTEMTKDDYGPAPFVCEGRRFFIPSIGDGKGGRAFVCETEADLVSLKNYYDSLGRGSAMLFSHTFRKGMVLVQINGDLPEATAKQYEAALP